MGQLWTNNASALLQEDIGPSNQSLRVQIGFGYLFPQPINPDDFFLITLESSVAPIDREIIRVSGRAGDYLTGLTRGWENTSVRAWAAGNTLVDHRITAGSILSWGNSANSNLELFSENAAPIFSAPLAVGPNSISIGSNARSTQSGQIAWTSGAFSEAGDSQLNRFALRAVTTSNTPVQFSLPGLSHLIVPANSTSAFKAVVTARQVGGSNHLGIEFRGVVYRGESLSSVIFQGKPTKWVLSRSSQWDAEISLNSELGALILTATGQNSTTIRWFAIVELVSISEVLTA